MNDTSLSLDNLAAGLGDPVHDSQAIFRVLLDTLSRPGTLGRIQPVLDADGPLAHIPCSAFAALLTLADYATPVWIQQHDDALAATVRFHTGAPIAQHANEAAFAYIHEAADIPAADTFALGEPETPDRSTTLLIRVDALEGGRPLTLSGPGIESSVTIAPRGIPDAFWHARAELAPAFPCGIDCYLVCGAELMGIPRTTLVEMN
ncbi:Alpha-D-ribose 1-methylphosphonate 5-triphosphate synthase subunit PhnH [Pararobbsia alpina]|uniref:phosphonate C-P lyase system protein PhnH n=1 Tax=Pararobbsia alpina TaxID=621374 RepID=UPI0039A69948